MDLEKLKRKRSTLRSMVTKLIVKLESEIANLVNKSEVEETLAQLTCKEDNLKLLDNEIEGLIDINNLEEEVNSQAEYVDKIIVWKLRASRHLRNISEDNANIDPSLTSRVTTFESRSKIKLPKLILESFSGRDVCSWPNFWARFKSAVHENEDLSEIEKFNYLKSVLNSEAELAIKGLTLTSENYTKALKILKDRFGRKELIIDTHMSNLLNLTPVRKSYDITALRKLYDECEVQVRGLESLDILTDSYSCLLYPIIMKAIPQDLALEFNRRCEDDQQTKIIDLLCFLKREIESRERTGFLVKHVDSSAVHNKSPSENRQFTGRFNNKPTIQEHFKGCKVPSASALNTSFTNRCVFCSENHDSNACLKNISERKDCLRKNGRCFVCLKKFHLARACESRLKCSICNRRHHKLICDGAQIQSTPTLQEAVVSSMAETAAYLLQTVRAKIKNKENQLQQNIRCLFDLGSQRTFITSDMCNKLKLPIVGEEEIKIFSFGNVAPTSEKIKRVCVDLQNMDDHRINSKIEALVIPVISGTQIRTPGKKVERICNDRGLRITDTSEHGGKGSDISLLIGCDFYWEIVTGKVKRLSHSLVAAETKLGWAISGNEFFYANSQNAINSMKIVVRSSDNLSDETCELVKRLWELEALGIHYDSENDRKFDNDFVFENFRKTVTFENNRYSVHLPWNHNSDELSSNLEVAKKRFEGLVRKFKREPNFYDRYKEVMDQYLKDEIAEETDCKMTAKTYFMPHQAVIREDKDTTKLRVVFDASSHARGCLSLNDCLNSGPNIYPDILELLIRFRQNRIAFIADIEKAFLQISLTEEDRNSVKFLWNGSDNGTNRMKAFRMTRVIFGAKSSPFLLGATLKIHNEKYKFQYPKAFALLDKNLYVDDLIAGAEDENEVLEESENIRTILKAGNFNMRKWKTNEEKIQRMWNKIDNCVENSSYCKVLGYVWNRVEDTLSIEVKDLVKKVELSNTKVTKREVLRNIGQLYDPIGFLNPFTIRARILLQEIWKSGLQWDVVLPGELLETWQRWGKELQFIQDIHIPRHQFEGVTKRTLNNEIQLHCYTDASQKAYGAILYFRYKKHGEVCTSFVTSKARVAPLKKISLPRLELMGAVIGSRLIRYVARRLQDNTITSFSWTDSKIVLHWIQSESKKWKPFVQNRVNEIQNNVGKEIWRHCAGIDNPADLLTRGERIENLKKNKLWWTGPKWLRENEEGWPMDKEAPDMKIEDTHEELRKNWKGLSSNHCITQSSSDLFCIQRYSSLGKIYRITAWCIRYLSCLKNSTRIVGHLTADEINLAERYWLKRVQKKNFSEEIKLLETKKPLQSSIRALNPFLDKEGLIRVGGRLQNSNLEYDQMHPIILPEKGHLIDLIIANSHQIVGHGGIADTVNEIREKFWLIRARKRVKTILHRCNLCMKFRAKPIEQDMAPLPPDRCREAFPFENIGIDYAGPLYTKNGKGSIKAYILLFTCAVTRAVHLELTSDMSTEMFLLAFKRFLARRGLCRVVFSDNAKTFKKAEREIDLLYQVMKKEKTQDFLCKKGIKWKYIVERGAWWGGFWERLVRSIKTCLKKILGRSSLSFRELETVVMEVEAILNSRPLTYEYADQGEPEPLTPGHFLIGRRLLTLPRQASRTTSSKDNLKRRFKHQQVLTERIWKRWRHAYLMDLKSAHHSRLAKEKYDLQPGTLVLVHEDKLSRLMWKTGLVTEVYPGRDGRVRACCIRLANGSLVRRPVQLLYPLELDCGKDIKPCPSGSEDVAAS